VAPGLTKSDDNYIFGPRDVDATPDTRYLGGEIYAQAINSPGAPVDTDGDGMFDADETALGRNPTDAGDLAFEFDSVVEPTTGTFEGWLPSSMEQVVMASSMLSGNTLTKSAKLIHSSLNFSGDEVAAIEIKARGLAGTLLRFYWATAADNTYTSARRYFHTYVSDESETIVIPLAGHDEWDGQTIVGFRVQPVGAIADFDIDHIRAQ